MSSSKNTPVPPELIEIFHEEAKELLQELTEAVATLSSQGEHPEQLLDIMGNAHSLKGIAGAVRNMPVVKLAHSLEDLLAQRIESAAPLTADEISTIADAIGVMEFMVVENAVPDRFDETLISLQAIFQGSSGDTATTPAPTTSAPPPQSASETPDAIAPSQSIESETAGKETLRIPLERLDHLLEQMEEMTAIRTKLFGQQESLEDLHMELFRRLRKSEQSLSTDMRKLTRKQEALTRAHRETIVQFGYLSDEMASSVKHLRMIPLSSVVSKWRNIVQTASFQSEKTVQFSPRLGQTEIDKQVLDTIQDSITHLLRNAVAHGIESDEERRHQNKAAKGTIYLRAQPRGSFIKMSIGDDGAGIVASKVLETAKQKKLVDSKAADTLKKNEIYNLLFEPGFSTAQQADHLRGRGVGLDVVKRTMENIGGSVVIHSSPGKGTEFTMTIPASLMALDALLVQSGDTIVAIPVEFTLQSIRVPAVDIVNADGGLTIQHENEPLRLLHLASLMEQPDPESEDGMVTIIRVQHGQRELGLIVDRIVQNTNLVIRPLPWNIERLRGISGAGILPDGNVCLQIDIMHLFEKLGSTKHDAASSVTVNQPDSANILVVDDSMTMRALHQNILKSTGYRVDSAENGKEAWALLQTAPAKFDLIISDVQMPLMDGFELTRHIKQDTRTQHLPVILVTNKNKASDIEKGMDAGADEYIVKSQFEQQALVDAIERLL